MWGLDKRNRERIEYSNKNNRKCSKKRTENVQQDNNLKNKLTGGYCKFNLKEDHLVGIIFAHCYLSFLVS